MCLPRAPCGGVLLVGGQLGPAHDVGQPAEHGVLVGGDEDHLPVGGGVDVARRDVGQGRAGPLALVAGHLPLGHERLHHGEDGLVDGGVDDLAATGAPALVQRDEGAQAGEGRRQRVAEGDPGAGRWPVRVAGDVADPAHRLADRAVARAGGVRAGLPEPGDPGDHEAGVGLPQRLGGQAPALQRAGTEVLDQHVGLGDHAPDEVLAARGAQVGGDRQLVAGDHRPPQRLAVGLLPAPLAHRVAVDRVLDLDDLRPEVAEELAAERAGQELAQLDDAQVVEGESRR